MLGEGETALPEILEGWRQGGLDRVPGIAFLDGSQVRRVGRRRRQDLTTVAFPSAAFLRARTYTECPEGPLPESVGTKVAVFETSRGCGEGCSFCDSTYVVGAYRSLALARLLAQIDAIAEADIRTILFADDNLLYRILPAFGGERGRQDLLGLFGVLASRGFSWTFYNGIQFGLLERDGRLDEELVDALFGHRFVDGRVSGCFRAYIPLEKFDDDEMKRLPKLRTLEVERAILAAIASRQVPELNLGFIIGSPRETPLTLAHAETTARGFGDVVRRASGGRSLPRFFPWCSIPIPGTPDHKLSGPHVQFSEGEYPELFSCYSSVIGNEFFSPLDFTMARRRMDRDLNEDGKVVDSSTLPLGQAG